MKNVPNLDTREKGEKMKKQTTEQMLELISFPQMEKTKDEAKLEKSVSELVDTMRELENLGRMTGRKSLPIDVYLAVINVLMDAVHLAVHQERRNHHVLGD